MLDEFNATIDENGKIVLGDIGLEKAQDFQIKLNDLLNIENDVEIETFDKELIKIDMPRKFYNAISFML